MVQIDPTFELEGLPVEENWRGPGKWCILQRIRWRDILLTVMTRLDESWAGHAPLPTSQRRTWCCFLLSAVGQDRL